MRADRPQVAADRSGGTAPPRDKAKRGSVEPAAEAFTGAWEEFVLALRRSQARGQSGRGGLSLAQYFLLTQLGQGEALSVCNLAEGAGIAAPTATRLVDGLERAGLLERSRSKIDRRSVLVSLTDAGQKVLRRKRRELAERRRTIYERLSPAERQRSPQLLRHLADVIDQI